MTNELKITMACSVRTNIEADCARDVSQSYHVLKTLLEAAGYEVNLAGGSVVGTEESNPLQPAIWWPFVDLNDHEKSFVRNMLTDLSSKIESRSTEVDQLAWRKFYYALQVTRV